MIWVVAASALVESKEFHMSTGSEIKVIASLFGYVLSRARRYRFVLCTNAGVTN